MTDLERDPRTDLERAALRAADYGDVDELARVGAQLDALDDADRARFNAPNALGNAACWYARNGVAVFPLQPGGKQPHVGSRGFKDATTDVDRVIDWWTRTPQSNIGAPTGIRFDVLDIDGPVGAQALPGLVAAGLFDSFPPIGRAMTPRGQHIFVNALGISGNHAGLVPGVDYRGAGGYVVLPPSRRDDGRRYRWVRPLDVNLWAEVYG